MKNCPEPKQEKPTIISHKFAVAMIIAVGLVAAISQLKREPVDENTEDDHKAANDDALVKHASRTALATIVIAVASILTCGAAFIQYSVFNAQLNEMRSGSSDTSTIAKSAVAQASATNKAIIASQRAWLKAKVLVGDQPLTFDQFGVSLSPNMIITNVGNTPAIRISPHAWLVVLKNGGPFPWQVQADKCRALRSVDGFGGYSLFPQEVFPENIGLGGSGVQATDSLEDVEQRIKETGQPAIMIDLIVCVDYTFPSDPLGHHQTGYIFNVMRKNWNNLFDSGNGRVDASELILQEDPIGLGRIAD